MEFKSNAAKEEFIESITCGVCFDTYSTEKKPVSIGCGHSLCYECVQNLPQLVCPYDRQTIEINKDNIPYNYDLLNLAVLFSKQAKTVTHQASSSKSSSSTSQVCRLIERPASSLPSTENVIKQPAAPVYAPSTRVVKPSAPPAPSQIDLAPTRKLTSAPETPPVRRIHVVRSSKESSFGFSIKKLASNYWFILGEIEPGSIAYSAGLRNDDRLTEFNGKTITAETSEKDMAKMIKRSKKEINLLITRNHGSRFSEPSRIEKDLNYHVMELKPGHNKGFGFEVDKQKEYFIIIDVDSKSPAKKSGVKTGDVIREVNGVEITRASLNDFNDLVQQSDKTLILGVQKRSK